MNRKMARKPKFTEETKRRILKAIQLGSTYKLAAAAGRVSQATFFKWMAEGRAGVAGKAEFLEEIKAAEAHHAQVALAVIMKSAQGGNWQSAAWTLERRHGYTKVGEVAPASEVTNDDLDLDQLAKELSKLATSSSAPNDDYFIIDEE
jgi:transposase-like protein